MISKSYQVSDCAASEWLIITSNFGSEKCKNHHCYTVMTTGAVCNRTSSEYKITLESTKIAVY